MEEQNKGNEEVKEMIDTAFLVLVPAGGLPAMIKTKDLGLDVKREANILDIRRALHEIDDVTSAQAAAQSVLALLELMAQQPKVVVPGKNVVIK